MRYVVLRDDDANGTTPPALLERCFRPFLERKMPVCLAAIPEVRADVATRDGASEVFVHGPKKGEPVTVPIADNAPLLDYLGREPGYQIAMHGCHHQLVDGRFEFDRADRADLVERLERGLAALREAGLPRPIAFVAPQDQISVVGLEEVIRRFTIFSTGYYDVGRVPRRLLPSYLAQKKLMHKAHFHAGHTSFLTHPGCILARGRTADDMLAQIRAEIRSRPLTVVVSHHSEFFGPGGLDDEDAEMMKALHALPGLFEREGVRVLRMSAVERFV